MADSSSSGDAFGEARSLRDILWSGPFPEPFKTPSSIKSVSVGFSIMLYMYLYLWYRPRSRAAVTLADDIEELVVRSCYVEIGQCDKLEVQSFTSSQLLDNGTLVIDGSATNRCAEAVCFDPSLRAAPLTVRALDSVINFAPMRGTVTFPLLVASVVTRVSSQVSKILFQNTHFESLEVNVTSGIVSLDDVTTTGTAEISVGFGTVMINSNFNNALDIAATTEFGSYCVAADATLSTTGACAGDTNGCPLTVSYTPPISGANLSNVTTAPVATINTTNVTAPLMSSFTVSASSLYVNDLRDAAGGEFGFVSSTPRQAGSAMEEPPLIHPDVINALNLTNVFADPALGDYIQAVEVVTPSLGTLFLHAQRRITLEVRPEWISFFSAFALRVNYRRFATPLSHYRCDAEVGRALMRPGSLSSVIIKNEFDMQKQGGYTKADFGYMLDLFLTDADQAWLAELIYESARDPTALVTFTNSEQEFSPVDGVAGRRWRSYQLRTTVDGTVMVEPLTQSTEALALVWISVVTALFFTLGVIIVLIRARVVVVRSFFLIDERDLLRNMVNYRKPCPYHYFASVLQISSWIAFRIVKLISENMTYPSRASPFGRFLSYYFVKPPKDNGENRVDSAQFKSIATDSVYQRYLRWAVLRFASNDISNAAMNTGFESFGATRFDEPKLVVRGLRMRKEIDPKARFALQYNALHMFYLITGVPSDTVPFDEFYQKAAASSAGVDNEAALVTKLRQWRFEVTGEVTEVAYGIKPIASVASALDEQFLGPTVQQLELLCASFPSYARVEWLTTGGANKGMRIAMYLVWVIVEDVLIFAFTMFPVVIAFLVTLSLEFEHSRYATSSSTMRTSDLAHVSTTLNAARPSNILGMTAFTLAYIYVHLMAFEPWLVYSTFNVPMKKKQALFHPQRILFYLRVLLSGIAAFIFFITTLFCVVYVGLLLIWWVLGAVIAPNRMLAYASSVLTALYVLASAYMNLDSMRKQALDRLKVAILEGMLKLVRASPAANLFDRLKTDKVAVDNGDGQLVRVKSQAPTVTSGVMLDAISDDRAKQQQSVDMIANSVECPHGLIWLALAVVKRDEKMLSTAVHDLMELMDLPAQFEPVAQQLTKQIVLLPVSALKLSHALYGLVPQYEKKLLEYDDIVVPLVQCALQKTFSPKQLTDSLRRIVHEELADRLDVDPAVLRRGFNLAWSLKVNDRIAAYKDGAAIMEILLPSIPEKPKSLRALYLCGLECMKLITGQRHQFIETVDAVVRRLDLQDTDLYDALAPLLSSSTGEETDDKELTLQEKITAAKKAVDFEVQHSTEAEQSAMSTVDIKVEKVKRASRVIMKRFATLVATRFSLTAPQTNELMSMFRVMSCDVDALEELTDELYIRVPITSVFSHAGNAFDDMEKARQKGDMTILEDLKEDCRDAPHKWLEVWIADQWTALEDMFNFRRVRPGVCDCAALAKLCGIPANGLRILRHLCSMVGTLVRFIFPDSERFDEVMKESIGFVSDPLIQEDELYDVIRELASQFLEDLLPSDLPFNADFVRNVRKRTSSAAANTVAELTNTEAVLRKIKEMQIQKTQKYLDLLETGVDPGSSSDDAELARVVAEVFIEHTIGKGSTSDIAAKAKKLMIVARRQGIVPVSKIPYACEAPDVDLFFDDLVDFFSFPYGTGNGDGLDMDWADSLFMDPLVMRLLGGPNPLVMRIPELEPITLLMTMLHDVEVTKLGASEAALSRLLNDLGVQNDEIAYAKLSLLFYSKRGTSLVDEEDIPATKMRFLKDAFLKAIELRDTNFHRSLITLMFDRLIASQSDDNGSSQGSPPYQPLGPDDGSGKAEDDEAFAKSLSLDVIVEACDHYKRLLNFLDYKLFPTDPEDIARARKAWGVDEDGNELSKPGDETKSAMSGQSGQSGQTGKTGKTKATTQPFAMTAADRMFEVLEFFCPHLAQLFEEREEIRTQQQVAATLEKLKDAGEGAADASPTPRGGDGMKVEDVDGDTAPAPEAAKKPGFGQTGGFAKLKKAWAQTQNPLGKLKDQDKLMRLRSLVRTICTKNPVVDMYITDVEGSDEDEVKDAAGIPVEVMDCFRSMSPFELMGRDVHPAFRELFAVMSGYTTWFPTEYSSKFYAACTVAALGPRTNVSTLRVLATVAPLKYQALAYELLELGCGRRSGSLLAVATLLEQPVADVEEARDLYYPPSVDQLYLALQKDKRAGLLGEKSKLTPYVWVALIKAAVKGDPYPYLMLLPQLRTSEVVQKFGFLISTGSYETILGHLYPTVDVAELVFEDDEKEIENALAKAMPVLSQKMDTIFLLEDEDDMWMDETELAVSKQMRKSIELLLGLVRIGRSEFDAAEKHLLTFAGSDEIMQPLVDIVLLAARLIVEDGAVADNWAIVGALESVARIALNYFRSHPLDEQTLKKHPRINIFFDHVLEFIADTALDLYLEYQDGAEDDLDPLEEAEVAKAALKVDQAKFAAEALANVNEVEIIDWMTDEFEAMRNIVEEMYDMLDQKAKTAKRIVTQGLWRPFTSDSPEGVDPERVDRMTSECQRLIDEQLLAEDELLNDQSDFAPADDGESKPKYTFDGLFRMVENMLNALSSFSKDGISYMAELVMKMEAASKDLSLRWFTTVQPEQLRKLELSLEVTPELMTTAVADFTQLKEFLPPESVGEYMAHVKEIGAISASLKDYCVASAKTLLTDGLSPARPTHDQIIAFQRLAAETDAAMQGLAQVKDGPNKFKAIMNDLMKTQKMFSRNADLFCTARLIFPMAEVLLDMRKFNSELKYFTEEKLEELRKYLKGRDGSGIRTFLRHAIRMVAKDDGQVESATKLMSLFLVSAERLADSPALETVIEEAYSTFEVVNRLREDAQLEDGTMDATEMESDISAIAKSARDAILTVLGTMDPGQDSGAALVLNLLKLVVQNRQAAIEARKTKSETVPLTSNDLRKMQLLLDLAGGNFEVVPEVIMAMGVGIRVDKQQQLIQLIRLIQSIKTIAQKKDLSSLTAADTIDIIAMQMFNEFDIEGKGEMSLDVFSMALERMQLRLSPQEIRLLFSKADRDGTQTITQREFRLIIDEIQERFRVRLIRSMGLSKEDIYLATLWTAMFLAFLFTFLILGVRAFANGTNFTAAITGLLPMAAGVGAQLRDPNALRRLFQVADDHVRGFFEVLAEP